MEVTGHRLRGSSRKAARISHNTSEGTISKENLKLCIRHTKGSSFTINVPPSTTVFKLKQRIFNIQEELPPELRGIPPEHAIVCLNAEEFDEELEDPYSLKNYGLESGTTILLGLCFRLQILDIFCIDCSASMYRSRNHSFMMSLVTGRSRIDETKEIISEWIKKHPIETDELPEEEELEWDEEERYSALVLFAEKVIKKKNPNGKIFDRATSSQMEFISDQVQKVKTKSWTKDTKIYKAIEECEKIVDTFREEQKNRGVIRVVLHLFTDGVDTSGEKNNQYHINKDNDITTFLYSFAASFSASHSLANKLGANLIFVKDVKDALREQDNLIYSFKMKPPSKVKEKNKEAKKKKKKAERKKENKKYNHITTTKNKKRGPEYFSKFNLLKGENPEVQTTKKFLKLVQPMFEDERVLKTHGIFRVSETTAAVKDVIDYSAAGIPRLVDIDPDHPHRAAHGLKNFLRQSESPLLHPRLQPEFLDAFGDDEIEMNKKIQELVRKVSPANRECLGMLFEILSRVDKFSEYNNMGASNLGIIFAPVLFTSFGISQTGTAVGLVTHMISLGPSLWETTIGVEKPLPSALHSPTRLISEEDISFNHLKEEGKIEEETSIKKREIEEVKVSIEETMEEMTLSQDEIDVCSKPLPLPPKGV